MAFGDLLLALFFMVLPAAAQPADDQPAAAQPADDDDPSYYSADDQPADYQTDDDQTDDDQPADDQPAYDYDPAYYCEYYAKCKCLNPDCIEKRKLVIEILCFIMRFNNIDIRNLSVSKAPYFEYNIFLHMKKNYRRYDQVLDIVDEDGDDAQDDETEDNEDDFQHYTIKVNRDLSIVITKSFESIEYFRKYLIFINKRFEGDDYEEFIGYDTIAEFPNFNDFCANFEELNLGAFPT